MKQETRTGARTKKTKGHYFLPDLAVLVKDGEAITCDENSSEAVAAARFTLGISLGKFRRHEHKVVRSTFNFRKNKHVVLAVVEVIKLHIEWE